MPSTPITQMPQPVGAVDCARSYWNAIIRPSAETAGSRARQSSGVTGVSADPSGSTLKVREESS